MFGRVIRLFWKMINRCKFRLRCTSLGSNLWAVNQINVENRGGILDIGNDCCFLSNCTLNPLCPKVYSSIVVNAGAELHIGNKVGISGTNIWAHKKICIGDRTTIGALTSIFDSDCHSLNHLDRWTENDMKNKVDAEVIIGSDVLIGTKVLILKGVHIGDRSIVAAGSVVVKDVLLIALWQEIPLKS